MRWPWRWRHAPAANGGTEPGNGGPLTEPYRPPPTSEQGMRAAWEAIRDARPALERAKRVAPPPIAPTGNPVVDRIRGLR